MNIFKGAFYSQSGISSKRIIGTICIAFAMIVTLLGLFMEPPGSIDDSILYAVAQFLAVGGALLGVTLLERRIPKRPSTHNHRWDDSERYSGNSDNHYNDSDNHYNDSDNHYNDSDNHYNDSDNHRWDDSERSERYSENSERSERYSENSERSERYSENSERSERTDNH